MKQPSCIDEILKYFGLDPRFKKILTQGQIIYLIRKYYLESEKESK